MKNLTFSINTEHIERIRNEVWQHIMLLTFRNYYTANITWFLEYISVTTSTNVLSNQQQIDFQINQKWKPNFFIGQKVSLTLIKENCHNSRTSDDIDMKLGPVTNLDKKNKTTTNKTWRWCHVSKLWRHCHFSNFWPIWSNLEDGLRTHSM